jgi:hypothetical protein
LTQEQHPSVGDFVREGANYDGPEAPLIVLAPYLPLTRTILIGDWDLVPFHLWTDNFDRRWCVSDDVAAELHEGIAAFRVYDGERIVGAVCLLVDAQVGHRVPLRLIQTLARSLVVAALSANPRVEDLQDRSSELDVQDTVLSESGLVYAVPLGSRKVAISSGGLIRKTNTLFISPDRPYYVPPPAELYIPDSASDPNADVGCVVYAAFDPNGGARPPA